MRLISPLPSLRSLEASLRLILSSSGRPERPLFVSFSLLWEAREASLCLFTLLREAREASLCLYPLLREAREASLGGYSPQGG